MTEPETEPQMTKRDWIALSVSLIGVCLVVGSFLYALW